MQQINAPTVRQIIDNAAEKYGDKTFIRFIRDGKIEERSYKQVRTDSLAVCRFVRSISKEKMHIALIGRTNYEYITSLTGTLISGCVTVPFAPETSVDEAVSLFERADIDILFYDESFAVKAEEIKARCPFLKKLVNLGDEKSFRQLCETYSDTSEYAQLSDYSVNKDECALIIFTSGTTGVRKGVMLSTQALVANNMNNDVKYSDEHLSLSILPMHHVFCFSGDYIKNLMEGVGICLNGNLRDLNSNLLTFQPNVMRVVPLIAKSLLQKTRNIMRRNPELTPKEAAAQVFGENMTNIYSGGAYLNPDIARAYDEFGFQLRQGYGMTEAGCRISVPFEGQSPESVGKVLSICDVRVVEGEIQVKTPSVMMGYYKMPEETAKMFTEDGWLKTGDVGYLDDRNQIFLTGRAKNIIVLSNGENVSPEAIEKKYESDPLVSEAIVSNENDMLVVEIYPDFQYAEGVGVEANLEDCLTELMNRFNAKSKPSHVVTRLYVRDTPFQKTASGKIMRSYT